MLPFCQLSLLMERATVDFLRPFMQVLMWILNSWFAVGNSNRRRKLRRQCFRKSVLDNNIFPLFFEIECINTYERLVDIEFKSKIYNAIHKKILNSRFIWTKSEICLFKVYLDLHTYMYSVFDQSREFQIVWNDLNRLIVIRCYSNIFYSKLIKIEIFFPITKFRYGNILMPLDLDINSCKFDSMWYKFIVLWKLSAIIWFC